MKTQILEAIGETNLSRSARLNVALAANERIKYYLSLLQLAVAQADYPEHRAELTLRGSATGIDDRILNDLVAESRRENGRYRIPGYALIIEEIARDLRILAAPALEKTGSLRREFADRLERLLATLPHGAGDLVERSAVDELTSDRQGEADSVHRLVMDLHKALNGIQAELTEEHLDGACVYSISEADRPLVAAFMAGLNRTAPLKFSHPGLETTATRAGDRLIIQNDLGTTDAHVIVIHVEGMRVEITHTDIHPERIGFLREMLSRYAVSWGDEQSKQADSLASGAAFHLARGSFDAKDPRELLDYLNFLGSRLVFLIDWNRARKELRGFLRGADRVALLSWAAEKEVGHRGFLELGGAQLINRAIEDTAGSAMHFGDRLCDVLGHEPAIEFIRFVFQAAMEGLREHQSTGLIQDHIRAELQAHFSSEGKRLFQLASEQAAMIFEIATLVQEGVRSVGAGEHDDRYKQLAKRAQGFEHRADQLVAASRDIVRRRPEYTMLFRLLETTDNAADELEEVAFLMDLLVASEPGGQVLEELKALADMLVEAAQEWIKALSHGSHVYQPGRIGTQEDIRDFLTAIDALLALEHRADDAERALTYAAVQKARDFRQLHIYSKMANSLEEASDALKWAGLMARDYLLGNVLSA